MTRISRNRQPLTLLASAAASAMVMTLAAGTGVAHAGPVAATRITGQASAPGFPAGSEIFDSATIGMGNNPGGSLLFSLYGPDDPTCSKAPVFTTARTVAGNAYYESDRYRTNRAGDWRWIAAYSGDAGNAPATTVCSDPAQVVSLGRRFVTFNGLASDATANGTIVDVVTLGSGSGPAGPTGNVTFTLYGPDNMVCAGSPIFQSVRTATGNGSYTSEPFRPAVAGTYRWVARYSGDADNFPAGTICTDDTQHVFVTPPTTTTGTSGDYDGNGTADVAIFRPSTGEWYVRNASPGMVVWGGAAGDIPVPGDYDGNGTTDVAVFRPSSGVWYIRNGNPEALYWGQKGDVPVQGDYDGNGTADVAIFRPSTGEWYVRNASPGMVVWGGAAGDIPVPGDYDGNGTTDVAVFRPSSGVWYIRNGNPEALYWGQKGDVPVQGDYDGNGTADVAIFRPSTGEWYVRNASPGMVVWGGAAGDIPVPGDYDGNGTTDVAVFRPSSGVWYIRNGNPEALFWGQQGDVPAHLAAAIAPLVLK